MVFIDSARVQVVMKRNPCGKARWTNEDTCFFCVRASSFNKRKICMHCMVSIEAVIWKEEVKKLHAKQLCVSIEFCSSDEGKPSIQKPFPPPTHHLKHKANKSHIQREVFFERQPNFMNHLPRRSESVEAEMSKISWFLALWTWINEILVPSGPLLIFFPATIFSSRLI